MSLRKEERKEEARDDVRDVGGRGRGGGGGKEDEGERRDYGFQRSDFQRAVVRGEVDGE